MARSIRRGAIPAALGASVLLGVLATQSAQSAPPRLPQAAPEEVGMRGEHLARIEGIVREWLQEGQMAGCVVLIARRGRVVYRRAFGHRAIEPKKVPMTIDTVFDLASITKPVATATSIMILVDRGKLRIGDRVVRYLPEFRGHGKERITIFQLLTHQGGLIPDNPLADYEGGRKTAFERIMALDLVSPPGERFRYTDVGFIVLGWIVERVSGKTLDAFTQENIFKPLGMRDTGYLPDEARRRRAAVTEQRDGRWMQGEVHDPRAYRLGGVAGHAGLFSTADDLAIYAQMLLDGGRFGNVRILSPAAVAAMTGRYRVSSGWRGLGWDKQTGYSTNRGEWMSESAFGHGGFTGTAIWIDPQYELAVIFLSNRLHPDGKGAVNRLAGRIGTIAVASIAPEAGPYAPRTEGDQRKVGAAGPVTKRTESKSTSFHPKPQPVRCGIDVLLERHLDLLRGKRVGLITNHTGRDAGGTSTVERLFRHPAVNLTALFSPEHGLFGKLDIARIADTRDPRTGLQVFSLYGKTRRPTKAMLEHVDVLVFDIQDIGTRFYTYISTMGLAMEAAAEHGKAFVVLDRPNPLGGREVEGAVLDAGRESFVGFHTLPVRHGMTIGELARMFRAERNLDQLTLHVVPMANWHRRMYWEATGCEWVDPSPNMRSPHEALLYPGIGLLETTNLSVGRGTDTPFEILGAPWLDGRKLARDLTRQGHPGLAFIPVAFTPRSSKYQDELCKGIRILVLDRDRVRPVRLGLAIGLWLQKHYPSQWDSHSLRLVGDATVERALRSGGSLTVLLDHCRRESDAFRKRRQRFLLYSD